MVIVHYTALETYAIGWRGQHNHRNRFFVYYSEGLDILSFKFVRFDPKISDIRKFSKQIKY